MVEKHCHQTKEQYSIEYKTQDSLQNGINYRIKSSVTNNIHTSKKYCELLLDSLKN